MSDHHTFSVRFLLLGNKGTGKSSLKTRFICKSYPASVCSDFVVVKEELEDAPLRSGNEISSGHTPSSRSVTVNVDCRIQEYPAVEDERNQSLDKSIFDSQCFFVLFDVRDPSSLKEVSSWVAHVRQSTSQSMPGSPSRYLAVVATCSDTDSANRKVSFEEGKRVADLLDLEYYEVSAKDDVNVQDIFHTFIKRVLLASAPVVPVSPCLMSGWVKGPNKWFPFWSQQFWLTLSYTSTYLPTVAGPAASSHKTGVSPTSSVNLTLNFYASDKPDAYISRAIPISDVCRIVQDAFHDRLFSIITPRETLVCEAEDQDARNAWIRALEFTLPFESISVFPNEIDEPRGRFGFVRRAKIQARRWPKFVAKPEKTLDVALKCLKLEPLHSALHLKGEFVCGAMDYTFESRIAKFQEEISLLRRLGGKPHRNIVRFWGCGEFPVSANIGQENARHVDAVNEKTKTMRFYLMELLDTSLSNVIFERNSDSGSKIAPDILSLEQAWSLAFQATSAVVHLHSLRLPGPVLHSDLNAFNFMLSTSGLLKLADFGSARILPHLQATVSGPLEGTVGYCAPEKLLEKPWGLASDVYSLTILLVELMNQRRAYSHFKEPYSFNVKEDVLARRQPCLDSEGPNATPFAKATSLCPSLMKCIKLCMAFDPLERPSALVMLECLQRFAESRLKLPSSSATSMTLTPPPSSLQQVVREIREKAAKKLLAQAGGFFVGTPEESRKRVEKWTQAVDRDKEPFEFDVFISYRVKVDEELAESLADKFMRSGLRVFFDQYILDKRPGADWVDEIVKSLRRSRLFLAIMSHGSLRESGPFSGFQNISSNDHEDMVFLEYQLASALADLPGCWRLLHCGEGPTESSLEECKGPGQQMQFVPVLVSRNPAEPFEFNFWKQCPSSGTSLFPKTNVQMVMNVILSVTQGHKLVLPPDARDGSRVKAKEALVSKICDLLAHHSQD